MGRQDVIGDLFRIRLRQERERRGMSQVKLADYLRDRFGISVYPQTIAKIEAGQRDVRIDELVAFSELFAISADAFLGRHKVGADVDVMWAVSRLTGDAQKMAGEVLALWERLQANASDVQECADRGNRLSSVRQLIDSVGIAQVKLEEARRALAELAAEFPLPGVDLTRRVT